MKLYETITAENWIQFTTSVTNTTAMCLMGHTRNQDEIVAIQAAIEILYPERQRPGCMDTRCIPCFNDHPDTTLNDVLRVCKLADV